MGNNSRFRWAVWGNYYRIGRVFSHEPPGSIWSDGGTEREGLGDEVAEGVACVGAGALGLVHLGGNAAGRIERPGDFFEVEDEFAAAGVDEEVRVARGALETGVDAIDTIAHGGVRFRHVKRRRVETGRAIEELADECPIGISGGGAALVAAGVAIDGDVDVMGTEGAGASVKLLTGHFGVGSGFDDDLIENVDRIRTTLDEQHAHGIDVEIDGPDQGEVRIKFVGLNVKGSIKGVIDAIETSAGESGFKFLTV